MIASVCYQQSEAKRLFLLIQAQLILEGIYTICIERDIRSWLDNKDDRRGRVELKRTREQLISDSDLLLLGCAAVHLIAP